MLAKKFHSLLAIFVLILGLIVVFHGINTVHKSASRVPTSPASPTKMNLFPSPSPVSIRISTLFVPYWNCKDGDTATYQRTIYFGLTPSLSGINTTDDGYTNLKKCLPLLSSTATRLLTLRMLNAEQNAAILKSKTAQEKIISDTIDETQSNGFSGIALDIEFTDYLHTDTPDLLSAFVHDFATEAHAKHLSLTFITYGDTFYRKRPIDLQTIAPKVDEVMVMAYDFHKVNGLPGPNFPLGGNDKYGYDMKEMADDFLAAVPAEKLTVIFGMYGYDWTVDETKKPIKGAKSQTDLQIQEKYIDTCKSSNCVIRTDDESAETEIDFVDSTSMYHIVWFENNSSVQRKERFLQQKGIGSFAFWANGYF
ncbi:hypothetical protein HGB07_01410 [Candidatus Roizmanbacteria bacterium]|nr:hypothetical protein [Candidatus Roizmanbacteria bacterium]